MQFATTTHNNTNERYIYLTPEQVAFIRNEYATTDKMRYTIIEELFPDLVGRVWCESSATNSIVYRV